MNDEQLQLSRERFKRETSGLPTRRELCWKELQNGVDPRWLAVKWQFPVETLLAAKEELECRESARIAERKGSSEHS